MNLLNCKACKVFENSDADLSWLLFLKKPTCNDNNVHLHSAISRTTRLAVLYNHSQILTHNLT